MGNPLPSKSRAQRPAPVETTQERPEWLGDAAVFRVLSGGERQAASEVEVAEISSSPTQPDNVLVELLDDGTKRVLILEETGYEGGELFGASNESNGPQFKVVDNSRGREGFDKLTRRALGLE